MIWALQLQECCSLKNLMNIHLLEWSSWLPSAMSTLQLYMVLVSVLFRVLESICLFHLHMVKAGSAMKFLSFASENIENFYGTNLDPFVE